MIFRSSALLVDLLITSVDNNGGWMSNFYCCIAGEKTLWVHSFVERVTVCLSGCVPFLGMVHECYVML